MRKLIMLVEQKIKIYRQNNLTFVLTPEKILVRTKLQMFYLNPKTHYYNRRMKLIRSMVELNEIRSLNELSSFCGAGSVEWISTSPKHYANLIR